MTVQEWLGADNQIGIDIWEKKYRYKNESFDEWLDRVSGGDTDLRQLIVEKKFLFGGRTLANRNTGKKGSFSNCFIAGTKIITKRGIINIEDIKRGDLVVTDDGTYQPVNNLMVRDYEGDMYKINAHGLYKEIICTPNHKLLTQNGWKRADRLLGGEEGGRINSPDKLKINDTLFNKDYDIIDLTEHFVETSDKKMILLENDKVRVNTYTKKRSTHGFEGWRQHGHSINRYVQPDSDFMYLIGRWLGDGSITRRKGERIHNHSIFQIVFNQEKEEDDALYIAKLIEKYFGAKPQIRYTNQNVIAVRFESEIVGSWFYGEFGEKCDGKYVREKYLGDLNIAVGLMDADGGMSTHGNFKIVLKNYNVLSWLRDTLFLNGCNTTEISDVPRQKDTYALSISCGIINYKLSKYMRKKSWDEKNGKVKKENTLIKDYISITNIDVLENQKCKVYNLSVENIHSYTANGVIVHNCYSRGYILDSLDDIMQANTDIAHTFKVQGGQGLSLSKLRPKGCGINNGQFESDGIIPFMEMYNRTTESISQGGSRKGALIMTLDIWHKEAKDFITIKSEENRIQKANLSLEIDDEFMECVKKFYDTGEVIKKEIRREYNGNEVVYEVVPIELYKLMMEKAYDWAEPGCLFTNRFRNYNLMEFHDEYEIETCNPCGEQSLAKQAACNLGSINLSEFVIRPFTNEADFDYWDFENAVKISIEALDKILDENLNNHALEEQKQMSRDYRNIGLGIMGLWDMLVKMNIKYGSKESINIVDCIMNFMFRTAFFKSNELGNKKGSFPKYSPMILASSIIKNHFMDFNAVFYGSDILLRNCSLISVAPTGSLGTMLNISTGCEPAFALSYNRKTESLHGGEDKYYKVYTGAAKEYLELYPDRELPDTFVTSGQIHWRDRIDMQAALQDHVDTAISSTINLPNDCTVEEIEQLYLYAWEKGLKGVTIYRDGCKRSGILSTDTSSISNSDETSQNSIISNTVKSYTDLPRGTIVKISDDMVGKIRIIQTGCGSLHCLAYFDPTTGDLLSTYFCKGGGGGCNSNLTGLSRLTSISARAGVDIYSIVDQLRSVDSCSAYVKKDNTSKGTCCPSAIGNALLDMYKEMQEEITDSEDDKDKTEVASSDGTHVTTENIIKPKCPECGEELYFEGGCNTCKACGYSKCD